MSAAAGFAAFQRDRFRELGRVRPSIVADWPAAWAPDRRYLVLLAPVGHHPSVRSAAARALAPLASVGVPPLDARRLHVTIQAVGYLEALPAGADRSSIPQALEALEGCRAIDLGIVGAGSFAEAAVLWLDPWEPIAAIRDRLLDEVSALAPARGDRARPPEEGGFAPHISIAYYDRARGHRADRRRAGRGRARERSVHDRRARAGLGPAAGRCPDRLGRARDLPAPTRLTATDCKL